MPRLISDNSYVSVDALRGVHIEHHGILGQKWGIRRFRKKRWDPYGSWKR